MNIITGNTWLRFTENTISIKQYIFSLVKASSEEYSKSDSSDDVLFEGIISSYVLMVFNLTRTQVFFVIVFIYNVSPHTIIKTF
jgi:hypothetical protein